MNKLFFLVITLLISCSNDSKNLLNAQPSKEIKSNKNMTVFDISPISKTNKHFYLCNYKEADKTEGDLCYFNASNESIEYLLKSNNLGSDILIGQKAISGPLAASLSLELPKYKNYILTSGSIGKTQSGNTYLLINPISGKIIALKNENSTDNEYTGSNYLKYFTGQPILIGKYLITDYLLTNKRKNQYLLDKFNLYLFNMDSLEYEWHTPKFGSQKFSFKNKKNMFIDKESIYFIAENEVYSYNTNTKITFKFANKLTALKHPNAHEGKFLFQKFNNLITLSDDNFTYFLDHQKGELSKLSNLLKDTKNNFKKFSTFSVKDSKRSHFYKDKDSKLINIFSKDSGNNYNKCLLNIESSKCTDQPDAFKDPNLPLAFYSSLGNTTFYTPFKYRNGTKNWYAIFEDKNLGELKVQKITNKKSTYVDSHNESVYFVEFDKSEAHHVATLLKYNTLTNTTLTLSTLNLEDNGGFISRTTRSIKFKNSIVFGTFHDSRNTFKIDLTDETLTPLNIDYNHSSPSSDFIKL